MPRACNDLCCIGTVAFLIGIENKISPFGDPSGDGIRLGRMGGLALLLPPLKLSSGTDFLENSTLMHHHSLFLVISYNPR